MWLKWVLWKFIVGHLARSHGYTDPIAIFSHIRHFSQPSEVNEPIIKAARWIIQKRLTQDLESPDTGLLLVGFIPGHFGPNDYYYWDDFWSVAGLYSTAEMLDDAKHDSKSSEFRRQADHLLGAIEKSLSTCRKRLGRCAIPALPYRRLDSGSHHRHRADYYGKGQNNYQN
jgi:hypothetical protein